MGCLVEAWPSPLQCPGQRPDGPNFGSTALCTPFLPPLPPPAFPTFWCWAAQEGECGSQYHAEYFEVAGREVFSGLTTKKGQLALMTDRPVAPT